MKRETIGYCVVSETRPQPTAKDFHRRESEANQDCIDRLTVDLQYGPSDLVVVPAIKRGLVDVTPIMTEEDLRTYNNIRARGKR